MISEQDADDYLRKTYKWYDKLSLQDQIKIRASYAQTTMMEYEMVKLETDTSSGTVKVKELSGMRKDRYSSISYSYWVACQLEQKLKPKHIDTESLVKKLIIRKGFV